jgi:hypothetical protein
VSGHTIFTNNSEFLRGGKGSKALEGCFVSSKAGWANVTSPPAALASRTLTRWFWVFYRLLKNHYILLPGAQEGLRSPHSDTNTTMCGHSRLGHLRIKLTPALEQATRWPLQTVPRVSELQDPKSWKTDNQARFAHYVESEQCQKALSRYPVNTVLCISEINNNSPSPYHSHIKKRKKERKKLGTVAHSCHPSYSRGRDQEDCGLRLDSDRNSRPISKITKAKQGWKWSSSGTHLSSKYEAWVQIPVLPRKMKKQCHGGPWGWGGWWVC